MSARVRAEDTAGAKTAAASIDKLVRIAVRDAKLAAEGAAELRRRGVVIEVVQGDAFARHPAESAQELAVFDPPYYLTTGYNGGIVPLGIYKRTAESVREFAANGNATLYTDSAWWLDASNKAEQTPDLFTGEMADREALSHIVDVLNAVAIVPLEGRHEIIGLNRPGEIHGRARSTREPRSANATGGGWIAERRIHQPGGRSTTHAQTAERVDSPTQGETPQVHQPVSIPLRPTTDARHDFDVADTKVRDLEAKLAAIAEGDSQEDDVEAQGADLQRQLAEARRERARAAAAAQTADSLVELDPVSQAMTKDPTVRALRQEKTQLTNQLEAAKKEGQPTEALLDRRDTINADLETIRRQAEQGTFPLTYEPPVAFGDANPPRTDAPPKTAPGADEPDHLRPRRILNWEPYTDAQLTEEGR